MKRVLTYVLLVACAAVLTHFFPRTQEEVKAPAAPEAPATVETRAPPDIPVHAELVRGEAPSQESGPREDDRVDPRSPGVTVTITGTLFDDMGHPIPAPAPVRIQAAGKLTQVVLVATDGSFTFTGLPRDAYQVAVVPESLPNGYAMPFVPVVDLAPLNAYERRRGVQERPDRATVQLVAARGAIVEGHVRGRAGEPVPDVMIEITNMRPSRGKLAPRTMTDAEGHFRFERVLAGQYRTRIAISPRNPWHDEVRPLPLEFEVLPGNHHTLPPLVFASGLMTVHGRVIDQDGVPFPDLAVLAYLVGGPSDPVPHDMGSVMAWCRTDAAGRWRFERLPRVTIKVMPGPHDWEDQRGGGKLLARWVEPIPLDLRALASPVDAGTAVAIRSRPYRLRGKVVLESAWAKAEGVRLSQCEARLEYPGASGLERIELSIMADGGFYWETETPPPHAVIHVTAVRENPATYLAEPFATKTRAIEPRPLKTETLTFALP